MIKKVGPWVTLEVWSLTGLGPVRPAIQLIQNQPRETFSMSRFLKLHLMLDFPILQLSTICFNNYIQATLLPHWGLQVLGNFNLIPNTHNNYNGTSYDLSNCVLEFWTLQIRAWHFMFLHLKQFLSYFFSFRLSEFTNRPLLFVVTIPEPIFSYFLAIQAS